MPAPIHVVFRAGQTGPWRIESVEEIRGPGLAKAPRLEIAEGSHLPGTGNSAWTLRGVTSNLRYTNRDELLSLESKQEGLGRVQATCAALIPIRKSETWWNLAQDERRSIFEAQSRHIAIGSLYLPAIARRLHHSRDLGEPFDFLTWFEFSPEHGSAFGRMLDELRATEEWKYVEREVEIRLARSA